MTRLFVSALMLSLLMVGSSKAQEEYVIDNSHTSVVFAVSHYNLSYTYGRFNKVSGDFVWNQNIPTASHFRFQLDANSIDTNDKGRDQHLRGPDFFDTQQHSTLDFKTTRIEQEEKTLKVFGEMTILGHSREIMIPMHIVGIGKGPFGKERAGFYGKFTIRRSEFGMDNMMNIVGDKIAITLSFEGIKKPVMQQASIAPGTIVNPPTNVDRPLISPGTTNTNENLPGSNPVTEFKNAKGETIHVPDAGMVLPGARTIPGSNPVESSETILSPQNAPPEGTPETEFAPGNNQSKFFDIHPTFIK